MALNTKAIKRRIKSVSSTKKITKAMQMISAVKMRRAVQNVLAARSYANLGWEIVNDIAKKIDVRVHPLLKSRRVKHIGLILITSNRGLAGGFSSRLLHEVHRYVLSVRAEVDAEADIILSGKHGRNIFHKFGHEVVAEFNKVDLTTRIEEILPIAQMVMQDFVNGKYDRIVVAYTDYNSAINQTPRVKQILPLTNDDGLLGHIENEAPDQEKTLATNTGFGYLFEPDPKRVLNVLLPRLVETQIYQAVLESDASEHSARMMAMQNATDAAEGMIKELNYSFNKARQAAITQEISEIVGGAAALE